MFLWFPGFREEPNKSPFVELFLIAGLPAAASIINFVVLTSAASSANSGVFSTSRMLFGLAQEGNASQGFKKLSTRSVPSNGLLFSCICLLLGAVLMYLIPNLMTAFTLITTISAILFMFVWSIILLSYLSYRKSRPEQHKVSKYKMPGGVFMAWLCLGFFAFILALLTLEPDTREALVYAPLWFIMLGVSYQFVRKSKLQTTLLQSREEVGKPG
ncbi:alanine glycine permease [Pseudomonas fluorescens HK44]|uniref:Alanine glycine permease n=1 Tax=Pseudomonas fluorescens HK44 TaxID=1042209 RepID=A0A010SR03_PSEFL|nr:alanine glycine permease [Pseudomonas fluorescens HK44]